MRFFRRFAGLERGHGKATLKGQVSTSGKHAAAHATIHEPLTEALWEQHIAGTYSLGVVPIRDDGTCVFGAIDIDNYGLKLDQLAEDIQKAGLPLILCRTKSGGAHLYLFLNDATPAELVRTKLMDWAVLLGHSGVEVFPKQTRLAGPNDWGNWINMPYFEGDKSPRYAIVNGKPLKMEAFLDLTDLMQMSAVDLETFQPETLTEMQEWLENGPPCLQTLAKNGFGEGQRNSGLFNIGVYLRKRYADEWEEKLDEYNQKFMVPPLGHQEVVRIVKSLNKKNYNYRCNEPPIVSVCNRQICLSRKFGVGTADGEPGVVFGQLVKINTQPPIWIWDVDGARIELTTQELKDQARFHTRCMEVINKWPNAINPKQWAIMLRKKLTEVEIHEAPPDASQEGQVWSYLERYCTSTSAARKREELLNDKPWTDAGRTYFVAGHFKIWLEQQARLRIKEKELWATLRKQNATHHFFNIKGRGINVWSIPMFSNQNEDFAVPAYVKNGANNGEM